MNSLRSLALSLALFAGLLGAHSASALPGVHRFALLVGTNDGGPERVRLRYAVSDARSFGRVLTDLGGLEPGDEIVLEEAHRADLLAALDALKRKVAAAKAAGQRTEAIVYYSGHSDEEGLLLGGERLRYHELRVALQGLAADVRIAVLDSCSSGTMARTKGGQRRPAFLVDSSTSIRGQAILTSSSADEASQESDRIGGSYFTHNLVSGLRGAADASGDGRVTLSEAYQFTFHETLERTEDTRAGAQHPSWDIDFAGAGDVVLTDLHTATAGLVLGPELQGRLFVRDAEDRLIAEVRKRAGESEELGLPPGTYRVVREAEGGRWEAAVAVAEGQRARLRPDAFATVPMTATVSRGGAPVVEQRFLNFGLAPFVETNAVVGPRVDNHLSIGLAATRSHAVSGVALSPAFTWIESALHGAEVAGGVNLAGDGGQGGQFAGGFNLAGGVFTGAQVAGGSNVGWRHVNGLQIAGGVNFARGLTGAQLSVLNIGGEVTGAQIGVVNVAGKVKGLQLGVVNLGREVSGASVGLLSLIGNGQVHLEAWTSDVSYANVGLKLGSQRVYTLFTVAAAPSTADRLWSAGVGLGVHFPFERWFLDLDVSGSSVYGNTGLASQRHHSQLRAMGGLPLASRFAVIAGLTLNVENAFGVLSTTPLTRLPHWGNDRVRFWPGLALGVRI